MKHVLVTGAQGNVGREVVRACTAAGFDVRPGVLKPAMSNEVRLDFTDPGSWGVALAGVDFVFLLRPPPLADMSTTLNPFVDAAVAAGTQHIVFLSVAGAETKSWVPHRKVEDHLRLTEGRWTVLRPGFFAQNLGDAYRRDIVEDDRLYVPAGQGRVAFLDVADVGDVTAHVFLTPERFRRQAVRLAGPEAMTFGELARRLSAVLGRPIRYEPASVLGYLWHLWRRRGMSWMQTFVLTVLHVGLRSGEAEDVDDRQFGLLGRGASPVDGYLERSRHLWAR